MPHYELSVIVRMIPRPAVVQAVKRSVNSIFEKGGVVRKIEYLGTKPLPFRKNDGSVFHYHGNYFLVNYNGSADWLKQLMDAYILDVDILRARINNLDKPEKKFECTLETELLPPAYRPSVQKMLNTKPKVIGKRFELVQDFRPF